MVYLLTYITGGMKLTSMYANERQFPIKSFNVMIHIFFLLHHTAEYNSNNIANRVHRFGS